MSVQAPGKKYFPSVMQRVYDEGIAVGCSNIKSETMSFRFRDEVFDIPTTEAVRWAKWNGYWYEIAIDDLRRIESEMAGK